MRMAERILREFGALCENDAAGFPHLQELLHTSLPFQKIPCILCLLYIQPSFVTSLVFQHRELARQPLLLGIVGVVP